MNIKRTWEEIIGESFPILRKYGSWIPGDIFIIKRMMFNSRGVVYSCIANNIISRGHWGAGTEFA